MRTHGLALVLSLFAISVHAQPTITSVSPSSGPVAGGTLVTIDGRDFGSLCIICSPPQPPIVSFNGVQATEVTMVSSTRLTARTPAYIPTRTGVSVTQYNGTATLPDSFEYTGPASSAFARILLPVFTAPIRGALGSEFHSAFEIRNSGSAAMNVFGIEPPCVIITTCVPPTNLPYALPAGQTADSLVPNGNPGRLIYIENGRIPDLWANLRAYDVSRNALSFGSQIPIPRDDDFREGHITLLGVPWDYNFRNTLRIYADRPDAVTVSVRIGDREPVEVKLTPGRNIFEPAYAVFTDFPQAPIPVRAPDFVATQTVEVYRSACTCEIPGGDNPRIWAFVSATNNTTQEITTIAP